MPATSAYAQQPTAAELGRYEAARAAAVRAAPSIWPTFRPDTIPVQLVLPDRGSLLLNWRGERVTGYVPVAQGALWLPQADRGAASTATQLADRAVAQVVVTDTSHVSLAGLIAHEAFHAFEHSVVRDSVKFGRGENSYYVSQYPVFDVTNETRFALELALLRDAMLAKSDADARSAARRYLAVRATRAAAMDPNVALFESMSELNEGMAEYALVRVEELAGGTPAMQAAAARLHTLLDESGRSVRLRFYVTGIAQALLLDRVAGSEWKKQLMRRDVTLQNLLDDAVGTRVELVAEAERLHPTGTLAAAARARVAALRSRVRARADSLMARPGVALRLDGSQTGIATCGFDPQNMLQLGDGVLLHTRWLKVCRHGVDMEMTSAVVQEKDALRAVVGQESEVTLTSGGRAVVFTEDPVELRDLKLTSPGATGTIARARVSKKGSALLVTIIEP